jgi:hypothetical protein
MSAMLNLLAVPADADSAAGPQKVKPSRCHDAARRSPLPDTAFVQSLGAETPMFSISCGSASLFDLGPALPTALDKADASRRCETECALRRPAAAQRDAAWEG